MMNKKVCSASSETWSPSRFNVSADLPDGRMAVFNTFRVTLVTVDGTTWQEFFAPGTAYAENGKRSVKMFGLLREKGLIVPRGVDETELLRIHFLGLRYSRERLSITLTPTLACNLRCRYCFEGLAQSLRTCKTMDSRTEDAVVRFVATQAQGYNGVDISWFGGEPLLGHSLSTIERMSRLLIPACDKVGIAYNAGMFTNGIFADRRAVNVLKKARVSSAQVTVDVPKSEKRDRFGHETLEQALDGIARLAENLQVTLRVNVGRDVEAEFDSLYKELLRRGLQKRLRLIYFADVRQPESGRAHCSGRLGLPLYRRVLKREQTKAAGAGLSVGKLLLQSPGPCGATRSSSVSVGPDGLLYRCLEDIGLVGRAYGSVFDANVRLSNLVPWLSYDWFQHKECRNCPVLPQCAGGCPHQRMFQADDLKRGKSCFWFMRANLKNRIREYAMLNGTARPEGGNDS